MKEEIKPSLEITKTDIKKNFSAMFEISGFYSGYGVVFGNSLRHILYSSLEGAAITKFKIKGIQHEFSTIPYVLQDVVSIMLNLKQLRFKLHTEEEQKISLQLTGEKEVKSGDFNMPTQVELINKDVHIATLTDKRADFELEAWVEKGIGYFSVDDDRRKKGEEGIIEVDAIFTPIRKVNFEVEDVRVGRKVDYDRLKITIETDGTITPEQALIKACEILNQHFLYIKGNIIAESEEKIKIDREKKRERRRKGREEKKGKKEEKEEKRKGRRKKIN
jgi:DNA-directed RNA polymerase subunit alpha